MLYDFVRIKCDFGRNAFTFCPLQNASKLLIYHMEIIPRFLCAMPGWVHACTPLAFHSMCDCVHSKTFILIKHMANWLECSNESQDFSLDARWLKIGECVIHSKNSNYKFKQRVRLNASEKCVKEPEKLQCSPSTGSAPEHTDAHFYTIAHKSLTFHMQHEN